MYRVIIAGGIFGVKTSTDNGLSWVNQNQGLTYTNVLCMTSDANYLYAGTLGGSVFRRNLSEVLSVEPVFSEIPENYALEQNFPNPFNPVTKIMFNLPESGNVKLTVFDMKGMVIKVIAEEFLKEGRYSAEFKGDDLASGTYFYRLETSNYSETKKMILIK